MVESRSAAIRLSPVEEEHSLTVLPIMDLMKPVYCVGERPLYLLVSTIPCTTKRPMESSLLVMYPKKLRIRSCIVEHNLSFKLLLKKYILKQIELLFEVYFCSDPTVFMALA